MSAGSSDHPTAANEPTASTDRSVGTPSEASASDNNDNNNNNNNNKDNSNDGSCNRAYDLVPAPQLPPLHTSQAPEPPRQGGSDVDSPSSPSSRPLSPNTPYPSHANHKEFFHDGQQQEKKPAEPAMPFSPVLDAKKWGCILWAVYFACMALVVMFWMRPQPLAAIQYCEVSMCKQYNLPAGLECAGRVTKEMQATGYVAFTLVVQVDNANWLAATVADVQLRMDDGGIIEYATCVGSGMRLRPDRWGLMTVNCKLFLSRPAVAAALLKYTVGLEVPIRVTADVSLKAGWGGRIVNSHDTREGVINQNNYTVFLTESLVQDKSCKQGIDLPYYLTDFYTCETVQLPDLSLQARLIAANPSAFYKNVSGVVINLTNARDNSITWTSNISRWFIVAPYSAMELTIPVQGVQVTNFSQDSTSTSPSAVWAEGSVDPSFSFLSTRTIIRRVASTVRVSATGVALSKPRLVPINANFTGMGSTGCRCTGGGCSPFAHLTNNFTHV